MLTGFALAKAALGLGPLKAIRLAPAPAQGDRQLDPEALLDPLAALLRWVAAAHRRVACKMNSHPLDNQAVARTLGQIFGRKLMAEPLAKPRHPWRSWMLQHADALSGVGMVGVLAASLVLFRVSGSTHDEQLEPGSIAKLSPNITWVDQGADGGETLEIVLRHSPTYMANILADLGRSAVVITRGLQQHFPRIEAKTIRFVIWREGKGVEKFVMLDRIVALDFEADKLMRLSLPPDFQFQQLLNLSDGLTYGPARDHVVVQAFCADEVAKTAAPFCDRELPRR
ncbi:hypothetical protein [Variovorax guangxiensis]|nr:hypothetical protein [Variovorax guangxiensis]